MKKYLKTIGIIVGQLALYELAQFVFAIIYFFILSGNFILEHKSINIDKIKEIFLYNSFIIGAIGSLISIVLFMIIYNYSKENLIKRCKFKKINKEYIIYIFLIMLGLSLVIITFIDIMSNNSNIYEETNKNIKISCQSILAFSCTSIFTPIFEEIFFRGIIFNELRKSANIISAIILQSLIFAIAHMNLIQGIYTFFLGIILAYFYIITNSIWSSILAHIIFNIMAICIGPIIFSISHNFSIIYIIIGLILLVGGTYYIFKNNTKQNCILKQGIKNIYMN